MAKGDVVSVIGALDTLLYFQPAAGIEVMITTTDSHGAVRLRGAAGASSIAAGSAMKTGITNAIYIELLTVAGAQRGFSGVQIK